MHCGLQEVPVELGRMEQLTLLDLRSNPIKGGRDRLPRQLQHLAPQQRSLEQLLTLKHPEQ